MSKLLAFDWATSWPLILLVALLVIYLVYMMFSRKKNDEKTTEMLNSLKKGDKVVTNMGIYGEIVSITETTLGKVVLLKTGEGKNISYISVNAVVVLGKDEKKPIVLDKDGNIIDQTKKAEEEKPVLTESKPEEPVKVESNTEAIKEEDKKPAAKKPVITNTPKTKQPAKPAIKK